MFVPLIWSLGGGGAATWVVCFMVRSPICSLRSFDELLTPLRGAVGTETVVLSHQQPARPEKQSEQLHPGI